MRLKKLALSRYGRFADHTLDFGDKPSEGPDLHLIYGPNEAGKSTLHDAYLDLLFGILRISPYAFLHDANTLRIDAVFETAAGAESVARIKKTKDDLLDGDNQPFPNPAFRQSLGRLDRGAYAAMFSLNDATLKAGGEGLIEAKGDFGSLLYGAASGVAQLGARLTALSDAANAIHRKGARSPTEVWTLRSRLSELKKEKAALDVSASAYARLAKARTDAAEADIAAGSALAEARQQLARLTTEAAALPKLRALRDTEAALAPLADLPDAPPDAAAQLEALVQATTAQEARLMTLKASLAEQTATLEALPAPDPILDHADLLEGPDFESLMSRNTTAAQDLPNRQETLAELDLELASGRTALGLAADDDILLGDEALAELDRLLDSLPDRRVRLENAADELKRAESEAGAAEAPSAADMAALASALDDAEGFSQARLDDLEAAEAEAGAAMTAALSRLSPWQGTVEALLANVPPGQAALAEWREAARALQDRLADATADRERRIAERDDARADAAATAELGDALDDSAFQNLRAERNEAWSSLRASFSKASADAFAAFIAATDKAADARLHAADALARQRAAMAAAEKAGAALQSLDARLETIRTDAAALNDRVGAAATVLGLPSSTSLDDLMDWLEQRAVALDAIDAARLAMAKQDAAKTAAQGRAKAIHNALGAISDAPPAVATLATLRRIGRTALDDAKRRGDALTALEGRRRAHQTEVQAMERWRAAWATATRKTWLVDATPEATRPRLARYRDLVGVLNQREDLARRVKSMHDDVAAFQRRITATDEALGQTPDTDAATAARRYLSRLTTARQSERERKTLGEQLAKIRKDIAKIEAEAVLRAAEQTALLTAVGAQDFETARTRLKEIDTRARLMAERQRLTTEIMAAAAPGESAPALLDRLGATDPAAQSSTLRAAEEAASATEAQKQEAFAARKLAEKDMQTLGVDGAPSALEQERQTVLLALEDAAERHLKLKLGVMAAERALNAYRDQRRSGMLERASETFRQLTGGSFQGLVTQAEGSQEKLFAKRQSGTQQLSDKNMSAGTRAQLYLALRVAGYHEVAKRGTPPPFVADDILETFDDGRSHAAFEALAEMARLGQVIYLTHHAHLIPLAEAAAPGLRVHRLPDPK